MKLPMTVEAAVITLCFSLLANGEATAAAFAFTKIADTNSFFSGLSAEPSINDRGTVAFLGIPNTETSNLLTGVFTSDGITTTTIANDKGSFLGFGEPSINNKGVVAFLAALDSGLNGVFTGDGTTITTIFDSSSSFSGSIGTTPINDQGTVAFAGDLDSGLTGVFTSDGTTTTTLFNSSDTFNRFIEMPSINDKGTVAFAAQLNSQNRGIFTSDGTTISTIFDASDLSSVGRLGLPSINNWGTVAFGAELEVGQGLLTSLLTSDGITTTTVADTSGSFKFFLDPSINDRGTVAFVAELDSGKRGLFTGSDPVRDQVIATGDLLFGSVVEGLHFSRTGLNNSGQIAFYATLADGTHGIYVATPVSELSPVPTPVPEPTSTLGILTLGALGGGSRLLRKQKK